MSENEKTQTLPPTTEQEDKAGQPESIQPENTGQKPDGGRKRNRIIAIILALVAVLCIGGVAWWMIARHQNQAAAQECTRSATRVVAARKNLEKAKTSAAETAKISGEQVSDATTVTALAKDLKAIPADLGPIACTADDSTSNYQATIEKNTTTATRMENTSKAITADSKKVVDSKAAKDLKDAESGLDQKIQAAQGTLDSTAGKVSDDAVRQALQTEINAATTLKNDTKHTAKALNDEVAKLETASKSVSDAVAAKAAADQAAAAAAAAAASNTARSSGSSSKSTGSSKSSGSTKSYSSTTKRSTGSTTSTPKSSSGSPSGSKSGGSGACTATHTGSGTHGSYGSTWDSYSFSGDCGW